MVQRPSSQHERYTRDDTCQQLGGHVHKPSPDDPPKACKLVRRLRRMKSKCRIRGASGVKRASTRANGIFCTSTLFCALRMVCAPIAHASMASAHAWRIHARPSVSSNRQPTKQSPTIRCMLVLTWSSYHTREHP